MESQSVNNQPTPSLLKQKTGLFIGAGVILILLIAGVWWLLRPSYEVLLQDIPDESRAEVLTTLMQAQVPYEIEDGTGNILVPSDQVAALRATLSSQGLPAHHNVGLELFSQGDYGMSEFAQRINYQRALEGELARTIQSIDEIRSARVHISLGKTSIFENRKEPAKASIALQLKPDQQLRPQQVYGIQQLVSAAVPALTPEQVIVLDEMGRSLTSADGNGGTDRWSSVRQLEQDYEQRARLLISGVLPEAAFQLSVKLQVNFDKIKSVKDEVIPAKGTQGGYLLKKREQAASGQSGSGQSATGSQNSNNAETEYVFGHERAEIEHAVGKIERINVGIVASQALPPQTVEVLRSIVHSGLGLVADRGDSLAIVGVIKPEAAAVAPDLIEPAVITQGSDQIESTSAQTTSSVTIYLVVAVVALMLAGLVLSLVRRASVGVASARGLSAEEREQLLRQARQWLAQEEGR